MIKTVAPPAASFVSPRFPRLTFRRTLSRMHDEHDFRITAAAVLDTLKRHLVERAEHDRAGHDRSAFEVREHEDTLSIVFVDSGDRFLIAPHAPTRQMHVAAPSAAFQLDWDSRTEQFILPRTGENLIPLVDRLLTEHH
jgi:frataxin-like iron-binding protein CyaY